MALGSAGVVEVDGEGMEEVGVEVAGVSSEVSIEVGGGGEASNVGDFG